MVAFLLIVMPAVVVIWRQTADRLGRRTQIRLQLTSDRNYRATRCIPAKWGQPALLDELGFESFQLDEEERNYDDVAKLPNQVAGPA